jgi:hypothetical protein
LRKKFARRAQLARRHRDTAWQIGGVNKLCIFVGTTIGGYAGWLLGDAVGLGFGWAFVLSGVGSMAGVYAGWKVAQRIGQ